MVRSETFIKNAKLLCSSAHLTEGELISFSTPYQNKYNPRLSQWRQFENTCLAAYCLLELENVIADSRYANSSSDAAWGTIMANIARAVQFNANTSILTDLDPSNNSPTLEVLRADFNGLMMRESIKVYTFQEAAGKSGLNAVSTKV